MTTLITLFSLFAALTSTAHVTPTAAATPSNLPRVRPYDGRAGALLLQGLSRSVTLREIVDELEASDVIVYIEMQPALKKKLAGTLTWLGTTETLRYVRVSLNPGMPPDTIIATLGHELQHALEVARAGSIVDASTLEAYYRANGVGTSAHNGGWDTVAAQTTGDNVRREIATSRLSHAAESLQAFNPDDWQVVYRRARGMLPP